MNPLIGESRNPFVNGKVVGPVHPHGYVQDQSERGKPDYIMSRSALMEFAHCPHRWVNGFSLKQTDDMNWGSLIDCLALTPDQFKHRYAVAPVTYRDAKTNEDKPWNWNANVCKQWREDQGDKEVLKHTEYGPAADAVKVLMGDPVIKELIASSQSQVMVTADYRDAETGITVPVKILIDLLPNKGYGHFGKCIVDLKTANSCHMRPWARAVNDHNYHCQAAMYLDVYTAATGEDRSDFLHIVQENYSPYETVKRLLSSEFIELGRWKYREALAKYAKCIKTGIWPTYEAAREYEGWQITEPEAWMLS